MPKKIDDELKATAVRMVNDHHVSGRDDQRSPVVEDVPEREDRGLVAVVAVE